MDTNGFARALIVGTMVAIGLVLFAGCQPRTQNYHVVVQNATTLNMRGVTVGFDGFAFGPMFLGAGSENEYLFVGEDHAWPTNAFMTWKLPDSSSTSCWLRVPGFPGAGKPPELVFVFGTNDVRKIVVKQ